MIKTKFTLPEHKLASIHPDQYQFRCNYSSRICNFLLWKCTLQSASSVFEQTYLLWFLRADTTKNKQTMSQDILYLKPIVVSLKHTNNYLLLLLLLWKCDSKICVYCFGHVSSGPQWAVPDTCQSCCSPPYYYPLSS